jgi:hypothetical protein
VTASALNVFVNCPFDEEYQSSFEALLFAITASGYRARCALEDDDAGDIRLDKLCRLVQDCDRSVHDLSRTENNVEGLPRFNMPFELGLFFGARRFGGKAHKNKSTLIMIREPYRLPLYLSDLGGNDPQAHHGKYENIIAIVRRHLHTRPDGAALPGAARIVEEFNRFKELLPQFAANLDFAPHEFDPFRDYRVYIHLLTEFLRQA